MSQDTEKTRSGRARRPRTATYIDAIQRIFRTVRYLDDNAEEMPSIETLAAVAGLSPYYFIRLYRRYVGETPGATALRLRLARARRRLGRGAYVSDVARAVGYASAQAFSAAFRHRYGEYPSQIRQIAALPALPPQVTWLESRTAWGVSTRGARSRVSLQFAECLACFRAEGSDVSARDTMTIIHDPEHLGIGAGPRARDEAACGEDPELAMEVVTMAESPPEARHLDAIDLPGGPHLLVRCVGDWLTSRSQVVDAIAQLAPQRRYAVLDAPVLWRPLRDPPFTPPSERVRDMFVPLRRL